MALPQSGGHSKSDFISEGQDDKEITSNDLDVILDNALHQPVDLNVTAGGTFDLSTPAGTLDSYLETGLLRITGTPAAATTILFPDGLQGKRTGVENISGQSTTIDTKTGATPTVNIPNGVTKILHVHGIEITVLADDSLQTGALLADGSVAATGAFDWADQQLKRPELRDYSETSSSPTSVAGAITLDMEAGNSFEVTLSENTTFTFIKPPIAGKAGSFTLKLTQDTTGAWTSTFPGTVDWPGGGAPILSLSANQVDILAFFTIDAGVTWYGFLGGLDFS